MKTKNKKTDDVLIRIVDTELSKHIKDMDIVHIKTHQQTAQKLSTMDFKAMPKITKISDFIGSLVANYQQLIDFTDAKLGGALQKIKGQAYITDTEEASIDIDRKINDVDKKITPLKGKFNDAAKKYEPMVKKYRYILWILYFIATIELIANFEIFTTLGGGIISSIAIAILVAITIFWYAHFVPEKITKYGNDNPKRQLALFFAFLIPIVIVFYAFASMRIHYLLAMNPDMKGVFNVNPLTYTLINSFAYVISCWIVLEFKPKREIINQYKKYQKDIKDIAQLEQEKEVLFQEKNALAPELRDKLAERYNILLLGKQTENEIVTRMKSCFEQFKMELYLKTNGTCSKLFTGDIEKDLPKLKLNYQDFDTNFPTT